MRIWLIAAIVLNSSGWAVAQDDDGAVPPEAEPQVDDGAVASASEPEKSWAVGVSDEAKITAFELYQQANAHALEQKYADAVTLYEQSLLKWNHPAIRYNLARTLIRLNKPVAAFYSFEEALKHGSEALDTNAVRAKELYDSGQDYLILLRAQLSEVAVRCDQTGVRVAMNGRQLFESPGDMRVMVEPGKHQVLATRAGYVTRTFEIDARAGQEDVVIVKLEAIKPVRPLIVPPVRYETRWSPWKPWALVGAGALIAGVGIPFAVGATNKEEDYELFIAENCPAGCDRRMLPKQVRDTYASGERMQRLSISSFAIGGAALAAGAGLVILNQPRRVREALRIKPSVSSKGAGMTIDLAF